MSVKRYTIYYNERERDMHVAESQDGKYVHHTDYVALEARHNALRDAVRKMRNLENNIPSDFTEIIKHVPLKIAARAEVDRLLSEEKQ